MPEKLIVQHCSPTLAGIKTGNLFSYACKDETEVINALRRLNQSLRSKGIRAVLLCHVNKRVLVYLYRPSRLKKDLENKLAMDILQQCGYQDSTPEKCIVNLSKRLRESTSFPHEIGLFLGYPPEDVEGFIIHKGDRFLCSGCWKVYTDVDGAQKCFAKYKKCIDVYCAQWAKGKSIERLAVAG